jgi:DNA-binding transcriptional ArsR family regulator
MPEGKAYGNATGNLPKGIDIRGAGGYVVVAPSLHKSGRRYTFAGGFSPADIAPLPLPQSLIDILETAQEAHSGPTVTFSKGYAPMPDLAQWGLSADTCELIQKGAPKGERSEADWRVVCELVRAGATDDDIHAVFVHFAIGSKFEEQGDRYLAHSIAKARARAIERPHANKEQFEAARRFIRSPQFLETLRAGGITRVAGPVACLDALLEAATPRRTTKIKITMRDLGDMYSVSAMSASRHIKRLTEVGIIPVELIDGCTTVDLSNLVDKTVTVQESVNYCNTFINPTDEAFYREHRGDDAFTSYPYVYAIKRRECPTVLMQSLGANGLLLWAALADGGTVKELAEATGLKVSSVRYTLKRFKQANLLQSVQECGRATEYWLCSNAEEMLEELREHMATAGKGQLSAGKNASATASYAHRQLSGKATLEPGKRAWLENRRDKCDAKAGAIYASLESMGINPHAKVAHRTPRPNTIRFDAVEEWRSWGRELWEVLLLLGDDKLEEKIRLLTVAEVGEDASIETYRNTRRAISERVDVALSLAPRRATLERAYTHADAEDDIPQVDATPTTLFAMPFIANK